MSLFTYSLRPSTVMKINIICHVWSFFWSGLVCRTENTQDYVHVGLKSTPSPKKKKLPNQHKNKSNSKENSGNVKLPRLDFSGKNSKNVRNLINSGRRNKTKGADDTEDSEENQVCNTTHACMVALMYYV